MIITSILPLLHKLPPFLQKELQNPPHTGGGVHNWLFVTALKLHDHLRPKEIHTVLECATQRCGRRVPQREIRAAIQDSARIKGTHVEDHLSSDISPPPKWPSIDHDLVSTVARTTGGLYQLGHASDDTHSFDAETIVDELFPGNPLLCCGTNTSCFDTKPRENWSGQLRDQQFVVPSPMSAVTGKKKDGTGLSAHTLDNTGPRSLLKNGGFPG